MVDDLKTITPEELTNRAVSDAEKKNPSIRNAKLKHIGQEISRRKGINPNDNRDRKKNDIAIYIMHFSTALTYTGHADDVADEIVAAMGLNRER